MVNHYYSNTVSLIIAHHKCVPYSGKLLAVENGEFGEFAKILIFKEFVIMHVIAILSYMCDHQMATGILK